MRVENNTLTIERDYYFGEGPVILCSGFYSRRLEPHDRERVESGVWDEIWDEIVHECDIGDLQGKGPYVSLYDLLRVEIGTDPDGTEWLEVDPLP